MDDLTKLLGLIVGLLIVAYRAVVSFLFSLAASSPVEVGYFFMVAAIGLAVYQHRREFYIHQDLDSDFDPSYTKVIGRSATDFLLKWAMIIACLCGGVILW